MKKTIVVFGLLFFLFCGKINIPQNFCYANGSEISCYEFCFSYNKEDFVYKTSDFLDNLNLSYSQKQLFKTHQNRFELFNKINNFGLSSQEKILYAFPELNYILKDISQKLEVLPEPPDVQVYVNTCKIGFKKGTYGKYLDKIRFFDDFLNFSTKNNKIIKFPIFLKEYKEKDTLSLDYVEKSSFYTNFVTSSPERKNNIKKALAQFDGIVLDVGESLSFNQTTGKRSEENGYKEAKIISGGTFVSGFGGGVCQVSTTLYNACLVAGLDVVEVHQHSLPVSYVEPSFDAMVNTGSSDLVIKNNTNGKIIITTSSLNDNCKVKIFGKKNQYKIQRKSEKTKIIPHSGDTVETDLKKFNIENLLEGEEKRISYAKDGYQSVGYLDYFDDKGKLIKTQKIRQDTYAPVKGVIVKNSKS